MLVTEFDEKECSSMLGQLAEWQGYTKDDRNGVFWIAAPDGSRIEFDDRPNPAVDPRALDVLKRFLDEKRFAYGPVAQRTFHGKDLLMFKAAQWGSHPDEGHAGIGATEGEAVTAAAIGILNDILWSRHIDAGYTERQTAPGAPNIALVSLRTPGGGDFALRETTVLSRTATESLIAIKTYWPKLTT